MLSVCVLILAHGADKRKSSDKRKRTQTALPHFRSASIDKMLFFCIVR